MSKAIHILIIEDDANFAEMAKLLVQPIIKAFPESYVTIVHRLDEALDIVRTQTPPPDITILDCSFPESTMPQTLAHLDRLEERTAVVIVTGSPEHDVRRIIGTRSTPYVEKTPELFKNPSLLLAPIYLAVDSYLKRKWKRENDDLDLLRKVTADVPPG